MQYFEAAIGDPHPQVRLEAVVGLRHIGTLDAVSIAIQALDLPVDTAIDFALFRVMHELRNVWLPAFESGNFRFGGDARHIAFAFSSVADEVSLQPLVDILATRKLPADQVAELLSVLGVAGDAQQLAIVVNSLPHLADDDAKRVAVALLQSNRNHVPENASAIQPLLQSDDLELRQLAVQLSGRWRVQPAFEHLELRVADAALTENERILVGEAMMRIDAERARPILQATYNESPSPSVAATAAVAMATGSTTEAAKLIVALLGQQIDASLIDIMMDGLLRHRDGPQELTTSLSEVQLPSDVAQRALDRIRLSGQDLTDLAEAIRTAGQLKPLTTLTPAEIKTILEDVSARGQTQRGAEIFQRRHLQCITCHRVEGEGGQVGPDLSGLGGSARVGDILSSLLEPSATIKQGYQTAHVVTVDGRIVSGIVQQRTQQSITISRRDESPAHNLEQRY